MPLDRTKLDFNQFNFKCLKHYFTAEATVDLSARTLLFVIQS